MLLPSRRALMRLAVVVLIVVSGLAGGAGEGRAQAPAQAKAGATAALPESLTREALRDLIARLTDAQLRELLLAQVDKEISTAPAPTADGYIHELEGAASTLRESWSRMYAAVPALPTIPLFLAERLQDGRPPSVLPLILFFFAVIFAFGGAAEWVYRRLTTNLRRQMAGARPQAPLARISYAMLRFGLDLLALAIFTVAAIGTFFVFYHGHVPVRRTVMLLVSAVFVTRLIALVSRFLLTEMLRRIQWLRGPAVPQA